MYAIKTRDERFSRGFRRFATLASCTHLVLPLMLLALQFDKLWSVMPDEYVQSLIDIRLWDAAGWLGTAFFRHPTGAVGLGLLFEDMNAGNRIFSGWRERIGKVDEYEELRIAIVRGEILGLPSGYSIHISSNPWHTARRAGDKAVAPDVASAMVLSRFKRMTPSPGSPYLEQFEKDFASRQRYLLVPASSKGEPQMDLAIEKRELHLRDASQIGPEDPDAAVFPEHYFDNDATIQ